jgi:hypothetical protein
MTNSTLETRNSSGLVEELEYENERKPQIYSSKLHAMVQFLRENGSDLPPQEDFIRILILKKIRSFEVDNVKI